MSYKKDSDLKNTPQKGIGTTQIILIIGFLVLIVTIVVAAVFIYKSMQKPVETTNNNGNLVVDESNLSDIEEQLKSSVQDSMFELNMNTIWTFPDAKSASTDAVVTNSAANHYDISFEILLGEEEEVIFTSTVIPVGKQIKEIILDKELAPGTYDAVCNYHLWKEDGSENSTFGVNVKLIIKE